MGTCAIRGEICEGERIPTREAFVARLAYEHCENCRLLLLRRGSATRLGFCGVRICACQENPASWDGVR